MGTGIVTQTRPLFQRILKIEPGISLGQWGYDRVAGNWERITAAFVAGGGMTYFAAVEEWIKPWGAVAAVAIGISSTLIVLIGLSLAQLLRAKATLRRSEATAIEKWKNGVDAVNPLDSEFHKKRIRIADLSHPVSEEIAEKKFTNCQLMGPTNLFIMGGTHFVGTDFLNCDLVLTKNDVYLYNVIKVKNSSMLNCELVNITLYIHPTIFKVMRNVPGVNFVNLTGDAVIDARLP